MIEHNCTTVPKKEEGCHAVDATSVYVYVYAENLPTARRVVVPAGPPFPPPQTRTWSRRTALVAPAARAGRRKTASSVRHSPEILLSLSPLLGFLPLYPSLGRPLETHAADAYDLASPQLPTLRDPGGQVHWLDAAAAAAASAASAAMKHCASKN